MSEGRFHPTHIDRINNWEGSDSYVEGAEVIGTVKPMEGDRFPYQLLAPAVDESGMRRRAGEIVMAHPLQVGAHHQKIEGVEYPPEAEPPEDGSQPPEEQQSDAAPATE